MDWKSEWNGKGKRMQWGRKERGNRIEGEWNGNKRKERARKAKGKNNLKENDEKSGQT